MLNIFITVDTELWPYSPGWPVKSFANEKTDFNKEFKDCFLGETIDGAYGLPFQLELLNKYGLSATYFLEPLFADRVGAGYLANVVDLIQSHNQEVQLHLHTEWLSEIDDSTLPPHFNQFMHQFSLDEQTALINKGIKSLRMAGATKLNAFRAGSYGANQDTLRAVSKCGLSFDSSYNPSYLGTECRIQVTGNNQPLLQPQQIEGLWEFPISSFQDFTKVHRHAQLTACSFSELQTALTDAWQAGWFSFVIVLHSFELVKNRTSSSSLTPDKINIKRFQKLCEFIASNPDKFRTTFFSEVNPDQIPDGGTQIPLSAKFHHSAYRYLEQGIGRFT